MCTVMIHQGNTSAKFLALMVALFISLNHVNAQQIPNIQPYGSRSSALGASYVTLHDFWSALNNPSNLANDTSSYRAGIFFENSYFVKELNLTTVGVSHYSKRLSVGGYLSRYGISDYNQGNAAVLVGKKIAKGICVGAKITYHYFQANDGYGSVGAFTGEFGITTEISRSLTIGAHIINPTQQTVGIEFKDQLPSALSLGITYQTPWGVSFTGDLVKPTDQSICIHAGGEWNLANRFFARVGFQSAPNVLSFGVGHSWKLVEFDLSVARHTTLGYSPQASAVFKLDRGFRHR